MQADIGNTTADVMAKVVIDGQIRLQGVGIAPFRIHGAVEIQAAQARGERVGIGVRVRERKRRSAGWDDGIVEVLQVGLQGLSEGVKQRASRRYVVVSRAAADGGTIIAKRTVGETETRHETECWRLPQPVG